MERTLFTEPATKQSVVIRDAEILEKFGAVGFGEGFGGVLGDGMCSGFLNGEGTQRVLVDYGRDSSIMWGEDRLEGRNEFEFKFGV